MSHLKLVVPDGAEHDLSISKPENVRLATTRDEPAILDLLIADLEENAISVAPISVKRITALIAKCTRRAGGFALVVDDPFSHEPIAVSLSELATWWWSDKVYLSEIVVYVSPGARHGHLADDLIRGQKWLRQQLSEEAGEEVHLLSGVLGTKRVNSKIRLFSRHSEQAGAYFIFPPVAGAK